jgi:hypothetical protein
MFLIVLAIAALPAFAQSTSTGTIVGTVADHTGAVIPNVTITITDASTKEVRTTTSNGDGQFVLANVPPGTYKATAAVAGFSTDETTLTVSVNSQTNANFTMAVGAASTTVEVQASNADLQTMNASTSETVDPAMTDSLPAISRDASQFASFMPGVTPNGSVAGTVSDQAVFQLDGGNDSSDMDGSMLSYTGSNGGSTTGSFLGASSSGVMPMPQDSIEEVRVSTSGQTADFNNSSGMQTSMVTKRGHDHWHGTVYEYYLDSNIGANTWQNNFPSATGFTTGTNNYGGSTSYTPKPSYHYSRFGAAAGGPIAPTFWGGKTYLFANFEGFRYPLAQTYERTVPSYNFMQGTMQFGATSYTAAQLTAADPRLIGMDQTLQNFYATQLPLSPASNNGATGANGAGYAGTFDSSCGALSTAYCDSVNTVGFKGNIETPQTSNFFVARVDHNFGQKNQLMMSFRYYKFVTTTSNQVDIGGGFTGDKVGTPVATSPRPQQPIYFVTGLTTNISSTVTNDVHYSYLRNFWQWKNDGDGPQISGAPGAVEPFGESSATTVLSPYNVDAQDTRTRIWNGKDAFLRDDVTVLKGDHLIQIGGQYQHNTIYHQRTDNGNAINYSLTYQIGDASGGGLINYNSLASLIPAGYSATTAERFMDAYYGFVTDTQVANTYTNAGGNLTLNPPFTSFSATSKVPYYNLYATDTWHMRPSLTLNYGLSYAIEMPPVEQNGNQTLFTDASGNPIQIEQYLAERKAAAQIGQVYNPIIGFSMVRNATYGPGNNKYPYNPFYGALSPRFSASWSPSFKDGPLAKIFGDNATVVRGGYGRIYGRINGDIQVLNPMLSPGLVLATQCRYAQSSTAPGAAGGCTQTNFTDTTAFRFGSAPGLDGLTAPLATAPAKLSTPVYRPGVDGPGVAIASPVDPTYRPNDVDTFNLSIQRQVSRKALVEVGYIGRLIHNELETLNPNAVPYMMSLGGQSFESAYVAVETGFGCTTSASLCSTTAAKAGTKTTSVNPTVAAQPFFEAALGGAGSSYCTGYASCTAAVVAKQAANFSTQKVYAIWSALDNNVNGAAGAGFVFPRSLMGTALTGPYGSNGQMSTGLSVATSTGYGNYNGGYVSFKMTDFHGLTLQENLTYSKALGLDDSAQSSSGLINNDSFNERESYGVQTYNQKFIFNTFIVYEVPYYKEQRGVVGRILGGWTISPVLTAGTGEPLKCTSNNGGQSFGGGDGSNFTNNEECVFTKPYTGGYHTHRGVLGSTDPLGVAVGTVTHAGAASASVNMFTNPVAVFDTVRPPILGLDFREGGTGPISGLGYLNLDASIKKKLVVWESGSLEFTGVMLNAMNHLDFANPSLSLQSATAFGVTKTQGNSPREIQMGVRANF